MNLNSENNTEKVKAWIDDMVENDSLKSFQHLHAHYYLNLLRFITMYVGQITVAEEIASDTFLTLWNNRKMLKNITNPNSYIYVIAKNKAVSYYRSQHMKSVELDDDYLDMFVCTETTPEEELISKESMNKLNAAINSLPEKCKLTFKLVREEKMKYKDVADMLGVSLKTVEAHMAKAVKVLRLTLESDIIA